MSGARASTRWRRWETRRPSPTPYYGWGILPDQYLRRFAEDDGETAEPADQRNRDLPPFRPWWGPGAGAAAGDSAG